MASIMSTLPGLQRASILRHCERSEAIQPCLHLAFWIAASLRASP
jgi:hypothetical protein